MYYGCGVDIQHRKLLGDWLPVTTFYYYCCYHNCFWHDDKAHLLYMYISDILKIL